jgi:thiamine-phosphate pyrophosphorylase
MPSVDFRLYLVTDRHQTAGRPLLSVVKRAVGAGVRAVQLRERDLPIRELLGMAEDLQRTAPEAEMFINDRIDVALAVGSRGAHLRESSLPTRVARDLLGPGRLLGRSVHSIEGVVVAEGEGADFVVLGPIYETPSKQKYGPPLGLRVLEQAARFARIPVFAIGGITAVRAREVRWAGGYGVAVMSSILSASDVAETTRALLAALEASN